MSILKKLFTKDKKEKINNNNRNTENKNHGTDIKSIRGSETDASPHGTTNDNKHAYKVIDYKIIQDIKELQMDGKPDILSKIIKAYISGTQASITELQNNSNGDTVKKLKIFTHTLKSSSASVGAVRLSELCKDLETACINNTVDDADNYIKTIESEFLKVKTALEKEIAKQK